MKTRMLRNPLLTYHVAATVNGRLSLVVKGWWVVEKPVSARWLMELQKAKETMPPGFGYMRLEVGEVFWGRVDG